MGEIHRSEWGCLVLEQVWWTLVDFTWEDGRWNYSEDMRDVPISVKNINGEINTLKQLAANESQKVLEVWLASNGSNIKHIEKMRACAVA